MFTTILVANRGEIACRVIATAHKLGIRCIAVYSDADQEARHVAMADEAFHIGPSPSKDSYLCGDKILAVAKRSGAQAIHPGYGFLSENPEFAAACATQGIKFIGPPVAAIEAMGSKSAAKAIMSTANVPLVPGYHGNNQDPLYLKEQCDQIGYPVLLKAAFGGGGKGMRVVEQAADFESALSSAKREAMAGFGNDTMLIEKYLTQPRHVEIQVFTDQQGNGVYLSERDCSVQRRHQKVIEEAPAPHLSDETRIAMGEAAVRAAQAIQYEGAGTVEFLYDIDGSFYFMEMNTRLQVEHPVTEMITGQDLVEWQLMVAAGQTLPLQQAAVTTTGHAIEVRIYAEDPDNEFLPATGQLTYLRQPQPSPHVRVDTGVREGDQVSTFYDPMIAKLIVWDQDRTRAIQRMLQALSGYAITGLKTNIRFLTSLLQHPAFQAVELETGFIEQHQASLFPPSTASDHYSIGLAALYLILKQQQQQQLMANNSQDPYSPWYQANGWRLNTTPHQHLRLTDSQDQVHDIEVAVSGEQYLIKVAEQTITAQGQLLDDQLLAIFGDHQIRIKVAHHQQQLTLFNQQQITEFTIPQDHQWDTDPTTEQNALVAPMNGTIVDVLCQAGAVVPAGEPLVIMEAMKMEYKISAVTAGTVKKVFYQPGDLVEDGALLIDFAAEATE